MIVLVHKILYVTIKNVFEWASCTFWKCCFRLTHCRVNFYSFSAAKFLELSSKFCPLIYPIFLWSGLFGNHFWKCFECFLGVFVFISLASTILTNKFWRTSEYFTPLLSFANLSTYARSIQQFSFLNLAKALILLKLRVACVNPVYEVFECKNSLSFDGESFAAFAKLRTEPYAANPWV